MTSLVAILFCAAQLRAELVAAGRTELPPWATGNPDQGERMFDGNAITPGTAWMAQVADSLRLHAKQQLDAAVWPADLAVVLSDASVPGEGEHKIVDFMRAQRARRDYNPHLRHAIYGQDADLILLGLARHEPHVLILRDAVDGSGRAVPSLPAADAADPGPSPWAGGRPLQWLHVSVLREFWTAELTAQRAALEPERVLDDMLLLMSLVGNDFVPGLPSLDIREGAADVLLNTYHQLRPHLDGYLVTRGTIHFARLRVVLTELAAWETTVYAARAADAQFFANRREPALPRRDLSAGSSLAMASHAAEAAAAEAAVATTLAVPTPASSVAAAASLATSVSGVSGVQDEETGAWVCAACTLRNEPLHLACAACLCDRPPTEPAAASHGPPACWPVPPLPMAPDPRVSALEYRQLLADAWDAFEAVPPADAVDSIQLHLPGGVGRYRAYAGVASLVDKPLAVHEWAAAYLCGLAWVCRYYSVGVASWAWFFPFHASPMASDLVALLSVVPDLPVDQMFRTPSAPYAPFSQLLAVLPAASAARLLPAGYAALTVTPLPAGGLADWYPTDWVLLTSGMCRVPQFSRRMGIGFCHIVCFVCVCVMCVSCVLGGGNARPTMETSVRRLAAVGGRRAAGGGGRDHRRVHPDGRGSGPQCHRTGGGVVRARPAHAHVVRA